MKLHLALATLFALALASGVVSFFSSQAPAAGEPAANKVEKAAAKKNDKAVAKKPAAPKDSAKDSGSGGGRGGLGTPSKGPLVRA